ncbi:MAG TPA: LysR substrate-binding domain-containing protein [Rhizobiaceae bacterium]|nr:LysR substrate-binding domain-containing protein [Rhizobiaceae bacterium]
MSELNRVHLNGLRAIEVAGRLGTLAKAAAEMGITIGAVSQHINKSEKQLGQAVFLRTPHGLTPTPFGAALLKHLEPGFRSIARGVATAQEPARTTLRVSTLSVFASKWLVPRLADFQQRNPGINIEIDGNPDLSDLDRSGIDVGLRFGRGVWPGTRSDLLLAQRAFPVCSPGVARQLKEPRDLLKVPVVTFGDSLQHWGGWLEPYGLTWEQLMPGPSFTESSMAMDATIAGLGVTLSWQIAAWDALRDGRLVQPFERELVTDFGLWFVTSAERGNDRKIGAFRTWLKHDLEATFGRKP